MAFLEICGLAPDGTADLRAVLVQEIWLEIGRAKARDQRNETALTAPGWRAITVWEYKLVDKQAAHARLECELNAPLTGKQSNQLPQAQFSLVRPKRHWHNEVSTWRQRRHRREE